MTHTVWVIKSRIDPWYWYHLKVRPGGVHQRVKNWLLKKILRPSKQLRAKNEFSRKYANYTVRIVMGLGKVVDRVLTSQSQVNLYKKIFFELWAQPVTGWEIGFTSKKIDLPTFFNSCIVFSTSKNPEINKKRRGVHVKKKEPVWVQRVINHGKNDFAICDILFGSTYKDKLVIISWVNIYR